MVSIVGTIIIEIFLQDDGSWQLSSALELKYEINVLHKISWGHDTG